MKILHLLRTEPDAIVKKLVENLSTEDGANVRALYQDDVDWSLVTEEVFAHDNVICWW